MSNAWLAPINRHLIKSIRHFHFAFVNKCLWSPRFLSLHMLYFSYGVKSSWHNRQREDFFCFGVFPMSLYIVILEDGIQKSSEVNWLKGDCDWATHIINYWFVCIPIIISNNRFQLRLELLRIEERKLRSLVHLCMLEYKFQWIIVLFSHHIQHLLHVRISNFSW